MDIVAELRQGIGLPMLIPDAEELMDKAAEEIERLRAAINDVLSVCDRGAHDSYDIYRACERARRALTNGQSTERK